MTGTATGPGSNYNNDGATGKSALAIGDSASAKGINAVAMGYGATASYDSNVAIGNQAGQKSTISHGSIFMGHLAGKSAKEFATSSLVFGSVMIGVGAGKGSTGDGNLMIGELAGQYQKGSLNIFLGTFAGAQGTSSPGSRNVIIGSQKIDSTDVPSGSGYIDDVVALGTMAKCSAASAVAMGKGALASVKDSVALGSGSSTEAVVSTTSITINKVMYHLTAGTAPAGTVSVGAADKKRTISNVAAGRVSATSTDAVSGAQLHATNQALEATATHYVSIKGTVTGPRQQLQQRRCYRR